METHQIMNEPQTNNFHRVLTLQGIEDVYTASLTIEDLEPLRMAARLIASEDFITELPRVPVLVEHRYLLLTEDSEMVPIINHKRISAWSDQIFDLLDLSICLAHLAEREDTTEKLADLIAPEPARPANDQNHGDKTQYEPYTHTVSWMMHQDFLGCVVRMESVNNKYGHGKRFVYFDFYTDDEILTIESMVVVVANPEAILDFARQLRRCADDIDAVIWQRGTSGA